MRTRLPVPTAVAGLLSLALCTVAHAGQIRLNVNSNNFTALQGTSLNVGDKAVWIWTSGTHSVTSGSACVSNSRFNSGQVSANLQVGTTFSWEADVAGAVPYFCIPHCSIGMTGSLTVTSSGTAVSDFRITEVKYDAAGGLDLIEIANLGLAAGDLGRYRFVASNDTATVPTSTWNVPAGGRVIVHVNTGGPQDPPSNMFLANLADLPTSGSLALYVPNTVAPSLTDANMIIDFVQWGAGSQGQAATAVTAGVWGAVGEFLPTMAANHSIEFCGGSSDHGIVHWAEISSPNFGSNGSCLTPTLKTTWGRVKTLYR